MPIGSTSSLWPVFGRFSSLSQPVAFKSAKVGLAGILESKNGLPPVQIPVQAKANAPLVSKWDPAEAKLAAQEGELRVIAQPSPLEIDLAERSAEEAKTVISQAKAWNRQHGFVAEDNPAPLKTEPHTISWWSSHVSGPFGTFLASHFPKTLSSQAAPVAAAGNLGVIYLSLSKQPQAGGEVVVNFGRKPHGIEYIGLGKSDKGFRLQEGERFVFNSSNWNQPAMAVIQLDPKLKSDTGVTFVSNSGNIPVA